LGLSPARKCGGPLCGGASASKIWTLLRGPLSRFDCGEADGATIFDGVIVVVFEEQSQLINQHSG